MQSHVLGARPALTVLLGIGMSLPAAAAAQYETVPRPAAYALEGVTVVQADGRRAEGVTLVVRGALIEAMGPGVAVPADAEVLGGDTLMVYPGLVDGHGDAKYEFPDPEVDRSRVEIWNAPREIQGFMPARRVVAHLTATGEDLSDSRKEGIVAGAVHPTGAMMPGRGALLLYRVDAERPDGLVIDPALGPTLTWQAARGVYPGTLFGVTAFIRQAFEDARHQGAIARAHASDPRRLTTPIYDADYSVLREVLAGDVPVYFEADEAADILRVLELADTYGFRPVILGGDDAWKVAEALERRGVPVLVSVDFDEPRQWDPDEDEADEPLDAAALREKIAFEDRYANAGRLAEAGVTFALTSGGSGEILEGARRAVEYGLSETAALAALTATPARLFGIPHVPRLEPGLPATFVVTRGPLFDEETTVAYTFVEGYKEEGEEPGAQAGSAEDAVDFGGTWDMTIDADGEIRRAELTVEQEGATFRGRLTMGDQVMDVRDGVINGNQIRAIAILRQGDERLEIEFTGTVEGDEASGEADAGPMGLVRWTAERTGPGGTR